MSLGTFPTPLPKYTLILVSFKPSKAAHCPRVTADLLAWHSRPLITAEVPCQAWLFSPDSKPASGPLILCPCSAGGALRTMSSLVQASGWG